MSNQTLYEPHPGVEGFAADVRATETVGAQFVNGMWQAYYYTPPSTLIDIHPAEPTEWCGAYAIGTSSEIVGWAWPSNAAHRPVFWKESGGTWSFTDLLPTLPLQFAIATDINTDSEIVTSYTDRFSYQGGHLYADYESPAPSAYALTDLVNLSDFAPNFNAKVASATGISDRAGSVGPTNRTAQRPSLFRRSSFRMTLIMMASRTTEKSSMVMRTMRLVDSG
ncbi:MAG: hypothetical protein D8M59_12475 [Planctomycetes bacterium]|nr:hypothetical protein [Planctomycetota bacterium]NOG53623.1 hypothetical protein [Planctomycetota bacterium]